MVRLGGDRDHRHRDGALLLSSQARDPRRIEASAASRCTALLYNKWYVDEIYDFLFVNGLCKGGGALLGAFDRNVVDGGVNGAGWLTRFTATALDLVGHLDHRWRGALQLVLREDALLPGVHPADRTRAGVRVLRGGRGPGVLRLLRGAVTTMDQHLLSIILFTPLAGLAGPAVDSRARTRT